MRIEGEYATTLITGGPVRLEEKTDAERRAEQAADRITQTEVLREQRWSEADLHAAMIFGFPKPVDRVGLVRFQLDGTPAGRSEPCYSRRAIAEHRAAVRAYAQRLK